MTNLPPAHEYHLEGLVKAVPVSRSQPSDHGSPAEAESRNISVTLHRVANDLVDFHCSALVGFHIPEDAVPDLVRNLHVLQPHGSAFAEMRIRVVIAHLDPDDRYAPAEEHHE